MRTFANPADVDEAIARIERLTPASARQWGRMTPNEMLCHLADSFAGPLGERPLGDVSNVFLRTIGKFIALKVPLPWPHGLQTMPTMDPQRLGTKPADFERDRARLLELLRRFVAARGRMPIPHPAMGPMTPAEWLRWGWLHVDHHLRQFGG